jgi:hypothetical protein
MPRSFQLAAMPAQFARHLPLHCARCPFSLKPQLWPAVRAGHWLGVKAPVARVIVLGLALRAERKACHGRVGPVVRDIADNAEARAAVGAVDEWIAVAAVRRVEKLAPAVGADRYIRRDGQVSSLLRLAFQDLKLVNPFTGAWFDTRISSIRASGGGLPRSVSANCCSASGRPFTAISTPLEVFLTQPVSPILLPG